MKAKELLLVSFAYLVCVEVVYSLANRFFSDAAGHAQVAAVVVAVSIAVWLYQSRQSELAPTNVKLSLGATLALVSVVQGIVFQILFHWMVAPGPGLFFGAFVALLAPSVLWNVLGKSMVAARGRKS